jgi:5'(3')-deoxyribonucleotidase
MKIEDSIFKKINDAKAEMAYDFNIKNLKKLIAMYEFYITTGLVNNKQILDKYLNEIISLYKRIDDEHKDMDFYKGLIKNYILMNEYKIASEILSEAKVKFENLENSENKETLVFLEVEIKFYENNYKFISENLKKNKDIFKKEKENLGVYEIWV